MQSIKVSLWVAIYIQRIKSRPLGETALDSSAAATIMADRAIESFDRKWIDK